MLVPRMRPFTSTIFAEMSALAQRTDAINLGQGFPDTDGPPSLLTGAAANIAAGRNQYPPGPGVPVLRQAVADHQRRFHGLAVDPDTVLVPPGPPRPPRPSRPLCSRCASRATRWSASKPYYDSYAATIALAGAVRPSTAAGTCRWPRCPGWPSARSPCPRPARRSR